jgi:hypothetical protein
MILTVYLGSVVPLSSPMANDDLPPAGRSLFDILTTVEAPDGPRLKVPFPFDDLRSLITTRGRLSENDIAETLLPIGRSLQRDVAAPDFFASPRVVLGVTGAPATFTEPTTLMMKDRLYLGYQPKSETLEVISFNEKAGRFEFQIVENYAPGRKPRVVQAQRSLCLSCHRGGGPIFSNPPWSETPANPKIAARLAKANGTPLLNARLIGPSRQSVRDLHRSVGNANRLLHASKYWSEVCAAPNTARYCKATLLSTVLEHRLSGRRSFGQGDFPSRHETEIFLEESQRLSWPNGFEIASPFIEDVDPLSPVTTIGRGTAEAPPLRVLDIGTSDGNNQIIDLLGDAFTDADIRWLERTLLAVAESVGAPRRVARVPCKVQPDATGGSTFTCKGRGPDFPTLTGRIVPARPDGPVVLIDRLSVGPLDYRDLVTDAVAKSRDTAGAQKFSLRPIDRETGLQPRTGDGWVVASVDLSFSKSSNLEHHATFTIRDDIKRFRIAASTLSGYRLAGAERSVTEGRLRGSEIMKALAIRLGQPAPEGCCDPALDLPPAALSAEAAGPTVVGLSFAPGPAHPSLQAFHRVCGACHAGKAAAPANFLYGSSKRQIQAITGCAPRILDRLAQWQSKTRGLPPMPPPSYLARTGSTAEQWLASTDYRRIQRLTAALGVAAGAQTSEDKRVLPACAPNAPRN